MQHRKIGGGEQSGLEKYRRLSTQYRNLLMAACVGIAAAVPAVLMVDAHHPKRWYAAGADAFLAMTLIASATLIWMAEKTRVRKIDAAKQAGICKHCGYDLRASPWRCPECGSFVASESET